MSLRGIKTKDELNPRELMRDTRTLGRKFKDFFYDPLGVGVLLTCCAAAIFVYPAAIDIVVVFGLFSFCFTVTRKYSLPFRMPQHANTLDYNDLNPGNGKPLKSRGILFLGNEKDTGLELWFSNDDMRTHMLIFGSTGSGKTEALISLAYNALVQGSGFIYVDGKGDNTLYSKIFAMTRAMGREDDLLLVNFMTGARDIVGPQEKRLSNTMNPFAMGSSSMLSQLVVSLMDQSSQSPDGDMWKGRAISFVEALMKVLVVMRDQGAILLDANAVRNYFSLERLEQIVMDKSFPRDGGLEPVSLEHLPSVVLEPITNYLINLPGYDKNKKGKQGPQVLEQHGFITMQLTRVFTSLADTYGHIIRTNLAEVDMKDVVLNRRILVVLLPAMEKSPDELSNLGKVIIATLKAMMAAGLGDEVEGDYHSIVQRKPTNSPTSFLCILDEYGYYAVPGFAVVPAQARSLGFSTIFAGQDLPAFQKASKEEAASIGANTNIKIAMKLEDPIETWEFFSKTAGEAYVTKVDAFQTKQDSITNTYMDTRSSSFEKRARIDLLDLKDQGLGEGHVFFKSKIVRANLFYANPPTTKRMRLNQFLKVEKPDKKKLVDFERRLIRFEEAYKNLDTFVSTQMENVEINLVAKKLNENPDVAPIERGVNALIAFHNNTIAEEHPEEAEDIADEQLNIFTQMRLGHRKKSDILTNEYDIFSEPIINKIPTREQIEFIERLTGKAAKHATNIAEEVIKDMQTATYYPPPIPNMPTASELAEIVNDVCNHIIEQRNIVSSGGSGGGQSSSQFKPLDLPDLPDLPDFPDFLNESSEKKSDTLTKFDEMDLNDLSIDDLPEPNFDDLLLDDDLFKMPNDNTAEENKKREEDEDK
ncbi:MAG: TraM recognition domain-containing protein [Legionellales bacterium]|nr:TraM recognition domain-containing protein [Legionellales bacterium]